MAAPRRISSGIPEPTLAARIALWLVLLSVITVLPGGFNRWALPKDAVLAGAAVFAAFAVARGRLPRWFWIVAAVGGALLAVSVVTSTAPIAELWGRYPRFEGLITLPVYLAAVWIGARCLGPGLHPSILVTYRTAVVTVSVLLGLLSIVEALGGRPFPGNASRPGAFLGNATDQGIVGATLLALLVAFFVSPFGSPRSRVGAGVGAAFAIATVGLSGSRAAILAAVAGLAVLGALALVRRAKQPGSRNDRSRLIAIAVAFAGVVGFAFLDPNTRNRVVGLSPLSGQTINDRFEIWRSAASVLQAHPLLGVGPSGLLDAIPATYDPATGSTLGVITVVDSPHSWPLQFALAGGWLLLALALATVVVVLVVGLRAWFARAGTTPKGDGPNPALFSGALAAVVACDLGLTTHLTSPGDAILPCFLVGVLIAAPVRAIHPPRWRLVGRVALSAWTIFLLIAAFSEIALEDALDQIPVNAARANSMLESVQAVRFWDTDLPSIAAETFAAASDHNIRGTPQLAISWARRSLSLTPGTQASLLALGVGETAAGQLKSAASTLSTAIRGNADNEQAVYRLGIVRAKQRQYVLARQELLAAAKLDPTDAAPWNALAYVYQQLGSKTKADASHAKAVALGG